MFPKRSPPQMLPSDRVRQLWTEFELWHAAQRLAIEQRVLDAHRELDLKWRVSSSKTRMSRKDLDERKTLARLEVEKAFNGNLVRLEWQKRLDRAGLQSDDWNDMTDAEQRKVEMILGVDLDPSVLAMPVLQAQRSMQRGALFSPVMNNYVRPDSSLDSYAVVDPHSFSSGENEDEPWTEVYKTTRRSDDEISLDASTSSSLAGFDGGAIWSSSSGVSRSSTQTSQTSSPEHIPSKFLFASASDVNGYHYQQSQSLLSAAKLLSASSEQGPHVPSTNSTDTNRSPRAKTRADAYLSDHDSSCSCSCSLSASSSALPVPVNDMSPHPSSSSSSSKSRSRYIGPGPELLTEDMDMDVYTDVDLDSEDLEADFGAEQDFEDFKMTIRAQKIREFHDEATVADIQLMRDIAEAQRRGKGKGKKANKANSNSTFKGDKGEANGQTFIPFTREQKTKMVEEHEKKMLELRKRKEDERKKIVEGERARRKAQVEMREREGSQGQVQPSPAPVQSQATATQPQPQPSQAEPQPRPVVVVPSLAVHEDMARGHADSGSTTSETPTIRRHRTTQRGALQMDWSSGGDTPTPTGHSSVSVWANKNSTSADTVPPTQSQSQFNVAESPSHTIVSGVTEMPKTTKNEKTKAAQEETQTVASSSKTTLDKTSLPKGSVSVAPSSSTQIPIPKPEPIVSPSTSTSSASAPAPVPLGFSAASSSLTQGLPKSKTETASTKSSSASTVGGGVGGRPKVMQVQSTSAIPSASASSSSSSTNTRSQAQEPVPASVSHTQHISTSSASASSSRPTVATSTTTSKPTTSASTSMPSSTASNSASAQSAWTSWAPTSSHSHNHSQPQQAPVPEDRRVWVPPATTENNVNNKKNVNKRPPPSLSRKPTDPPAPQIEKSVSNPHTHQAKPQPIPIDVKRARRNSDPSSPSPKSFEFPISGHGHGAAAIGTAKVADKRAAESGPSGILKKSGAGAGLGLGLTSAAKTQSASATQKSKKKVTIEEVADDDEATEGVSGDHLPTDSRYIMEPMQPKPIVPSAMFTQIFEYDAEKEREVKVQKEKEVKEMEKKVKEVKVKQTTGSGSGPGRDTNIRAPALDVPKVPVNSDTSVNININSGRGNGNGIASAAVPDATSTASSSKPTKPKQVRWSSDSQKPGARDSEQPDSFLSMLDSLEAIMHGSGGGNDNAKQKQKQEAHQQADKLSRLLSETTERPRRGGGGGEIQREGHGVGVGVNGRPGPGSGPVYAQAQRGVSGGAASVW
ncbi:hypothetical protein D9758_012664 [Tetrapyrgos nigripes]|uniref:Uncharacterized protein n=1 Tax=Tetrapyrgos nigripes TaxID=182062 RepID=A0A8H5GDS9_9AGAR|nr:hypothetical protein D9758_012664 [Tetrapyrgos nigripes]